MKLGGGRDSGEKDIEAGVFLGTAEAGWARRDWADQAAAPEQNQPVLLAGGMPNAISFVIGLPCMWIRGFQQSTSTSQMHKNVPRPPSILDLNSQ